jgi:hypothetical protein
MATVEIFDPATGAWTKADPMRYARYGANAVTLADGRILVAGSGKGEEDAVAGLAEDSTRSAEVYDPATGRWSMAGRFPAIDLRAIRIDGKPDWVDVSDPAPWDNGTLVALDDGGALLVGNRWWWKHLGDVDRVLRFDGATTWDTVGVPWFKVWSWTGSRDRTYTSPGRATGDAAVALLAGGRVLIAGGDVRSAEGEQAEQRQNARLYLPAKDAWKRLPDMPGAKSGATAAMLPDGSVMLVGGFTSVDNSWQDCSRKGGVATVYRYIP